METDIIIAFLPVFIFYPLQSIIEAAIEIFQNQDLKLNKKLNTKLNTKLNNEQELDFAASWNY